MLGLPTLWLPCLMILSSVMVALFTPKQWSWPAKFLQLAAAFILPLQLLQIFPSQLEGGRNMQTQH